ncbi:MAG: serine protease [Pseudomonadota bacterium]
MPRCFFHDDKVRQCENEASDGNVYCALHQEFENNAQGKIDHLIAVVAEVRSQSRPKKKDVWDKVSASATFFTGIFVGLVGIIATATYNNRELASQKADQEESIQVQRVEIVQKFFAHLVSDENKEQRGALLAIAALGDEKLATDLARNFGNAASIEALTQLAGSSDPSVARQATVVLDEKLLIEGLSASTLLIEIDTQTIAGGRTVGTAFIVSSRGYALTAAHLFKRDGDVDPEDYEVQVTIDGPSKTTMVAHLVQIDTLRDVALIRLKGDPNDLPLPLEFESGDIDMDSEVFAAGFRTSLGLGKVVSQGRIVSTDGPSGTWVSSLQAGLGLSGAPVANERGKVVAYVVGSITGGKADFTLLRPASEISDLLRNAGVDGI